MKKYSFLMVLLLAALSLSAQTAKNIRYVKTNGLYANSGLSWDAPKNNIQDAINDLVDNGLDGEVWVAAGTYKPTESTESNGGSTLHMSFKIPAGITIRGGFRADLTAASNGVDSEETRPKQDFNSIGWFYQNQTVLSGDLSTKVDFAWDSKKEQWAPTFYGNCYHVLWFAMNGFDANGRANDLTKPAMVEGCVIEDGHAYNNSLTERKHNAYGGGAYMVGNATVQNCYFRNCDASRDGGAIYMDGGGMVIHSYISDSQALGVGVEYGYGGGICMEGSDKPGVHPLVVTGSGVTNCVGRLGGGIATKVNKARLSQRDNVAINATLVNNNTATTEGGGVYILNGGAIANATIVMNKCNGTGVTSNGLVTGRAGGLYVRDNASIANTVIWGNVCKNHDIQYASTRSAANADLKPTFYYNAVSKNDLTDWSGTTKKGVKSLADTNSGTVDANHSMGFPIFMNPTTKAGAGQFIDFNESTANYDVNHDGKKETVKISMGMANLLMYSWKTSAESALHHAGISTYDITKTLPNYGSLAPETSTDITGISFNPRTTLGAYTSEEVHLTFQKVGSTANFYIDPDYLFGEHTSHSKGDSWDTPTRFLANVFEFIERERAKANSGTLKDITTINVHVKQGTVDNTDSYRTGRVREMAIEIPSDVNVYGSYDASLKGTDLSKRNPIMTPTIISGEILDDYNYYVSHLIKIDDNKENILIDGFQMTFANAESTLLEKNGEQNGAAITIKNSTNNIRFKNIVVSNCKALRGPAVYANNATATFENCIFHNNTAFTVLDVNGNPQPVSNSYDGRAIVYGVNNSNLTFDHCDVIRNVGYASYLDSNTHNTWTNTIFYGNISKATDDTNTNTEGAHPNGLPSFIGTTANATGNHCMFDATSASFSSQFGGNDTGNPWQYNLQYKFQDGTLKGYPRFINPTRNAGVSEGGDVTYYGRSTSYEPHNNNPIVNMASTSGPHTNWGKDITTLTTRDYGGLPDIGAVENHNATTAEGGENAYTDGQARYGEIYYVREYRNPDNSIKTTLTNEEEAYYDGSSWEHAINGNALYHSDSHVDYVEILDTSKPAIPLYTPTFKGFKIYNINNGTKYYLTLNGTTLATTTTEGNATVWQMTTSTSTASPLTSVTAGTRYIWTEVSSTTYYLKFATSRSYSNLQFNYSGTPSVATSTSNAGLTISASNSNNDGDYGFYMARTQNSTQVYMNFNGSALGGTNSTTNANWLFHVETEDVQTGTTYPSFDPKKYEETRVFTGSTLNGLQYAVNKQNAAYEGGAHKQVWVGAGTYSKDPETGDQSCFVIKDGVDVYGAFPKTGNPAMDQRQALVSQYVKVVTGHDYNDYETIIEPITKTIQTDVTRRVLAQPWANNPANGSSTDYNGAEWNGFTIRHGVLDCKKLETNAGRDGGGGVALYRNVKLVNCVVTNNTALWKSAASTQNIRAGGVYMDGGTVAGCYLINNLLEGYTTTDATQKGAAYGGGLYLYNGTVYNTVIANNRIYAQYSDGAGAFMENATFFNNTIVNNKAEGTSRACGGIAIWTSGTSSTLNMYNSIIVNNEGKTGGTIGNKNVSVQQMGAMYLYNCVSEAAGNLSGTNAAINFYDCTATTDFSTLFEQTGSYSDRSSNGFKELDLRLKSTASVAINKGIGEPTINDVTYDLSEYNDMDYRERIQDCTIDIGAYEYNGSLDITPETKTVGGVEQAIFYVTPEGYGTASGHNPENAACASKLQKVIDAAGRYKYQNPTKQVIVKVANDYAMAHAHEPTHFTYYATRTTDFDSQDVRVWSIIVPRGVEIWGGYTDVARTDYTRGSWSNTDNGFYDASGNDARDITANPTYFDSYYVNKQEKSSANTYHVVTFTDHIFDSDGYPYLAGDADKLASGQASSYLTHDVSGALTEDKYLHMSDVAALQGNVTSLGAGKTISTRAVVDGIFISGGQADGRAFAGNNANKNINGYGGAAIVTDYAHVRNCILTGNTANYGGALALKDRALVSGSLFLENNAEKHGGALYVFEEGSELSDGTSINTGTDPNTAPAGMANMDELMPHVYTSTIVNNHAMQGGGIWFSEKGNTPNVRVNSTVIWQNSADDQANVCGNVAPNKPADDMHSALEFYPFAYSAVQNLRLSGANNMSVDPKNEKGVRFIKAEYDGTENKDNVAVESNTDPIYGDFGYFGLTDYSVLNHTGMPINEYESLINQQALATADFKGMDRLISTSAMGRTYIEIGARAYDKVVSRDKLMLRLFVAMPEDIDMNAAGKMMALKSSTNNREKYYSQEGSSFAYPYQSLQDALNYIYLWRSDEELLNREHANNLPFEIYLAKGNYQPSRDLVGNYGESLANTFAIPEGVSVMGGFAIDELGANNFYGAKYEPKPGYASAFMPGTKEYPKYLSGNVQVLTDDEGVEEDEFTISGLTIKQLDATTMLEAREHNDNNANNIIEPWEFVNQTFLEGDVTNAENSGVYHVVTAVADQNVVGMLPKASIDHDTWDVDCGGYEDHEEGQTIHLNGLVITGGYARHFTEGSLDEYGKYIYYQGGGLQVDGNRYNDNYNKFDSNYDEDHQPHPAYVKGTTFSEKHRAAYGVGYRDILFSIANCQFINNQGGYGGAISSNGTLDIFQCAFEQNLAVADSEPQEDKDGNPFNVQYPGNGGAILSTHQLSIFNSLFANNEARSLIGNRIAPYFHTSFRVPDPNTVGGKKTLDAAGGAICNGIAGKMHIVNCNFVRNKANMYPAVYTLNPNYDVSDIPGYPMFQTPDYNQIINTVFWGNEVNKEVLAANSSDEYFTFGAQLNVNYGLSTRGGTEYVPEFGANKSPRNQADLDANFEETIWFSAYESGTGITPVNNKDMRDLDYKPYLHGKYQITHYDFENPSTDYTGGQLPPGYSPTAINEYQNCNLVIDRDNEVLEGPNFVNPSNKAGIEGFYESADWSPSRLNSLTDMGSGKIYQTIVSKNNAYGVPEYESRFDVYDAEHPVPADRAPYSNEQLGDYRTYGAYTMTHYIQIFPEYGVYMPLGNEHYMKSAYQEQLFEADGITPKLDGEGNPIYKQQDLYRISYDPNPTHNQTYIDIGVYEYPHTPLNFTTEGDEVDVIWVSSAEKPDNGLPDGSDWTQPTSDLQRAIETLLASRNGHRKEIRLMDGTFTPIYTIENQLSFLIDTKYLNGSVTIPESGNPQDHYVKSLTFKGGYSRELKNQYDVALYPAIMRSQQRTDANSDRWDHLLYIKDATQRYHDGKWLDDGAHEHKSDPINTIPIEIDGVTFINDQAKPGTKGAAIYYADTDADQPTSANISTDTEGVKRIYYTTAEKTVRSATETAFYDEVSIHEWVTINTPNKLVISKSIVMGSGTGTASGLGNPEAGNIGSAVYIGKKGGNSLLFNTVFHSNYANALEAYNTININNTFAKNTGWVELIDEDTKGVGYKKSAILNSILWQNNMGGKAGNGTIGKQFSMPGVTGELDGEGIGNYGTDNTFMYNAYTGGNENETDYKELQSDNTTPTIIATNKYNVGLNEHNSDVIYGPNFTNVGSDEDNTISQFMERKFTLQPSLRLLNKGNKDLYNEEVVQKDSNGDPILVDGKKQYDSNATVYDMAWVTTTSSDAASKDRISPKFGDIDLGAYEYQQRLDRILYVNPNETESGDGLSWETSLGYGKIQDAIDLAGVFYVNSVSENGEGNGQEAYVFVKGASTTNKGMHTGEALTFRNGVTVFGSLPASFNEVCGKEHDNVSGTDIYTDAKINEYLEKVKAQREGVASTTTALTTIKGIYTNGTGFLAGVPAVLDGFDVTAKTTDNATGKITGPVIDVDPYKNSEKPTDESLSLSLRNIIVHDNDASATSGVNIAHVNNALMYEVLMRDNKVASNAAVLALDKYGYVVNSTIEGKTKVANRSTGVYADAPLNGGADASEEATSRIHASLVNYMGVAATENTLSGYNYPVEYKNLNYQLTEQSKHIDEIDPTVAGYDPKQYLPASLRGFVNYDTDLDILGNPRILTNVTNASKLDRGAFETWKVENDFICGYNGTNSSHALKISFYPHDGSVVYIMKGKSLVIDPIDGNDNKPTPHNPSFMLLQEGASCYGNGRPMTCAYLAIERPVKGVGNVVSVPYPMDYSNNSAEPSYDDETGVLTLTKSNATVYDYDGSARADWQYNFHDVSSPCWVPSTMPVPANQGVLFVPDGDKTIRFTAKGASMNDYIYTEEANAVSKTVVLNQFNDGGRDTHENGNTDDNADFTQKEDMGWNAIGLPWLVSEYKTQETINATIADAYGLTGDDKTAAIGKYMMHIPHTLWMYYDGENYSDGSTKADGDGGFYSVSSWDANDWHLADGETANIWVGEGFFTQTATLEPSETLTFHRPVAPTSFGGAGVKVQRFYMTDDIKEVEEKTGAYIIDTRYYGVDGVQLSKPKRGVTIIQDIYSDGTTRSRKVNKR